MGTKIMKRFISGAVAAVVVAASIPLVNRMTSAQSYPEGFVYADDGIFKCDGSPYYYGGTNCYYLTYKSDSEVKNVFDDAKDMGLSVIRVWGNLDVGKKTGNTDSKGHQVFEGNNDGDGQKDGIYFQYWDDAAGRPVVNEGADGLRRLDYVIKQAEDHDMKLIITFTNYWEAFGGMGQYYKWYQMSQGQTVSSGKVDEEGCCNFYTNETIKGWYKDYIKTLLNHKNYYTGKTLKESSGVFAWELANEPRCKVDEFCENDVLYNWAKEMSEYVKSIDPDHMVSIGDEGFYNMGYQGAQSQGLNSGAFSGYYGVDFEKNMTIKTVDFGTPHMYVDQWGFKFGTDGEDDIEWIKRHAETTAALNKPIIFEEFGLTDKSKRDATYKKWLDIVTGDMFEGIEYQGFNYWMIASYLDDGSLYPDYDSYTVYGPTGTVTDSTRQLIVDTTNKMVAKNNTNCTDKSEYTYDRASGQDVTINVTLKEGSISGVKFNGTKLSSSDYTKSGTTIKLKSSFLKNQELTKYSAKILIDGGNSPKFTVVTTDSQLPKPTISPTDVTVDINPKICSDVVITMDKKTSEFRGLVFNGEKLTENTDYTVSGDTVTINASFLRTLSTGANEIVFDFYEGDDSILNVAVSDTTGLDELDTFEGYESDSDLWNAYSKNDGGNDVGLSLVTKNGSKALAFTYDVSESNGYCGVNHPIAARNMSTFKGISFDIEGDGSGNSFTLQLRDGNDKYFEKEIKVDFTGNKTILVPFDEFVSPSWQSDAETLDSSKINQFSLYAGKGGSKTTGTYYIDNIVGYIGDTPVVVDAYLSTTSGTYDGTASGVRVDMVLNGQSLKSITYNGNELTGGVDYSTNGCQVMLNEKFLDTLANGTYTLVFNFSNNSAAFTLTVNKGGEHVHSYTSTVTKQPTCTEKGTETYTCECGDTHTKEIPSLGHNFVFEKKIDPTETTQGYSIYKCERCGVTENRDFVDPIGHTHTYTSKVTKQATCTESGVITYTCSGCDNTYTEVIPAKGHTESDWIIDKAATNTESGSKHTECTVCGATLKTEVIAPTGDDDDDTVNFFSGNATCGSWCQAVSFDTKKNGGSFDPSIFKKGGYVYVEYAAGGGNMELVLQSWSGAAGWARVSPYESGWANGHKYDKFSYDDMVKAFGTSDFSGKLDKFYLAAAEYGISVYSASYVGGNGGSSDDKPTESDPYVSVFWGSASCGNWGQAVCIDMAKNGGSFSSDSITSNSYFYVEYSGAENEVELILQSWSGGANWAKVQSFENGSCNGNYYAKFSYNDMVNAFGSDFGKLDRIYVGAKNGSITVYSVCCCYPN